MTRLSLIVILSGFMLAPSIHAQARLGEGHVPQPIPAAAGSDTDSSAGDARSQVTAFVFRSLDDSSSYISNETVRGKVYLVDFWATWCPPCVEALPDMEEIYEAYHDRGFEIISLSFDSSDERIRQFRSKRFRMPWLHGRLESGFNDILAITFGVQNIPHYLLVDRHQRIIASGDDLHGERLRGLLDEELEK